MTIQSVQPYLLLINTIISLGVLGIIFNLIKTHRENMDERINGLKERLDGSREDSERKDKWFAREKEQLEKEKNAKEKELLKLQTQLDEILKKEGVTFQNLALGQTLKESTQEVRSLIGDLSTKMLDQIKSIVSDSVQKDSIISESQLTLAKAQMAKGSFDDAADSFEQYTSGKEASWEVYFSKAVNLANLRQGRISNQASVKAYSDAINALPKKVDPNVRARVFGYRGAILKRLERLDEAEADLNIAQKYATAAYETDDILYNQACVYAMQGNKEKMLSSMFKIKNNYTFLSIKNHLTDYFKKFDSDSDFRNFLSSKVGN
jgi:tetratricopeptide (TPR) repeat protein